MAMLAEKVRSLFNNLSYFVFWLVLAILAALVAFQLHTTWITISIAVIENPSLRPTGWSIYTTYGLSRFFWLVLGILWLGWVMFTEGDLSEGKDRKLLLKRSGRLLLILGIIYGINYLIMLVVV